MLRRVFGTVMVLGVLTVIPFTIQGMQHDRLPAFAMNDLRCEETGDCCRELNSICTANGKTHINQRAVDGSPCKRQ